MSKPRLLDLFCGAGGCSVGYARAGFEVVGIDVEPMPSYPFEFHQMDALRALRHVVEHRRGWDSFDAIHASPPCQAFSLASLYHPGTQDSHPDLVDETRELLEATGLPYVMENGEGSPLRRDLVLCGEMFGLRVHRHRVFELGGWFAMTPDQVREIKLASRDGVTRADLARQYGVHEATIYLIATGKTWAYLEV